MTYQMQQEVLHGLAAAVRMAERALKGEHIPINEMRAFFEAHDALVKRATTPS